MIPSFPSNQFPAIADNPPEGHPRPQAPAGTPEAGSWMRRARRSLATKPHLTAVLVIAVLLTAVVAVLGLSVDRVEARYIHAVLASDDGYHSLRSLATERCALRQADLLPVYGSSELVKPIPDRATLFFRTYPTGFSIFPIGKAGTYPLIMLQHIVDMGPELRGRKVVISLSSGWYRESAVIGDQYRGNFLLPTAREFLFSTHVSRGLRQAAARRFLQFPDTLVADPVTNFAARRLAAGSRFDQLAYWSAWPLGRLQILVSRWQDHFEVLAAAGRPQMRRVVVRRVPKELDWPKLIAAATAATPDRSRDEGTPHLPHVWSSEADGQFLASLEGSPAWGDLDLLLRSLREVGAQPLLLCTPIKGHSFNRSGVSKATRDVFYRRMEEMARWYDFPMRDFSEHDDDRNFVYDRNDHLSEKGWMYYNQALDDFMHDRMDDEYFPEDGT